jgi:hydroxymethylpyrimidine/phosphomethylpyrimidine kinase
VQDTTGVEGVLGIDGGWVADQARALLEDIPVAAFKCGLLGSVEGIAAIAEIVADYPGIPLIFDPVLASGRGDQLADEEMVEAMVGLLLPLTTILTPNSMEARRLASDDEGDDDIPPPLPECARRLVNAGAEYVLVTGTHENTPQVANILYGRQGKMREDKWDRLPGSYHGSGCTLASAIAANMAHGLAIEEAVRDAQEFVWKALAAGFRPGMGQYIPDRLFWARCEQDDDE